MTLKILCSTAFHAVMPEILENFQQQTKMDCDVIFGTSVAIVEKCHQGEQADLVILTQSGIETLLIQQFLQTDHLTVFTKTGVGIAALSNNPAYEISNKEDFINTILRCQSIGFTKHGASGMFFARLIKQLGIDEQIRPKAVIPEGGLVGELVKSGQVELGIQLVSEILAVKGITLLGFIPEELQEWSSFSIAKTKHSLTKEADLFIDLLKTPQIQTRLSFHGFMS